MKVQDYLISLAFLMLTAAAAMANEESLTFLRIGTGGKSGTYYPVGSLIAEGLSNPRDSEDCIDPQQCGVPHLFAVAQLSIGSVANIQGLATGELDAGLVQADVAYFAYSGTRGFKDQRAFPELRVIASLYPEHLHLVASRKAGISSPSALRGKTVSLDEPGSGTLVDALMVLDAYGLNENSIQSIYLNEDDSIELLKEGKLDAFFSVAGIPAQEVSRICETDDAILLSLDHNERDFLTGEYAFFYPGVIPAGTYQNQQKDIETVSVSALLVTTSKLDDYLVYQLTRALWNSRTRTLLETHPRGKDLNPEFAVSDTGIPFHQGARRFYREIGVME